MNLKNIFKVTGITFIMTIMFSLIPTISFADGLINTNDKGAFIENLSSSLFTGITKNGETIIDSTTIYQNNKGDTLFGFPLNLVKVELIRLSGLDGENSVLLLDKVIMATNIGGDTFYLGAIRIDHPYKLYGGGFIYDPSHWFNGKVPIRLGLYALDTGRMLGTFEMRYEISPGYYFISDIELGMESAFNRDYIDGKIALQHNMNPEGTVYVEAGYMNRVMDNYLYFGAGIKIF